ncbi:AIPR family protein [Serratia fonticola]|uniref:AIPR family protein n=1 Tax=Serratia fonticola TaxID=47917 RepID=UPI0021771DA6|nr:AIPR family protein [Serratia fonticola]CAI1681055.1 AIPR protein [Serratia fonticola]
MIKYNKDTQVAGINRIAGQLETIYSDHLNIDDINSEGEHRRNQIITRCIAAHAVSHFGDEPDPEVSGDSVCDRKDDAGVDAIYINNNAKKVIIVQSKFIHDGNGTITEREFIRFKDACEKIISNDLDGFNDRLLRNKESISNAVSGFGYKYICVFAFSGVKDISKEVSGSIDRWEREQNKSLLFRDIQNREEYTVLFESFNISNIAQSLQDGRTGRIDLNNVVLESYGELSSPYEAIYGCVTAATINEWWKKYKYSLFEKNIRNSLGKSTSVNDGIKKTVIEQPENFWYYNNGVTAVYSEFDESNLNLKSQRKFGMFNFKNVSIINGAQTVSVIGESFESIPEDKRDELKVHIRFINAVDNDFLTQVTKNNNTQNRVTGRDFVSQRPEQQKIQSEINFIGGYTYRLLRQDTGASQQNDGVIDIDDVLNALVCQKKDALLLANLKSNRGRFYETGSGGLYDRVFDIYNLPSGIEIINSVKLYRECENVLRSMFFTLDIMKDENIKALKQVGIHGNYLIISMLMQYAAIEKEDNGIKTYDNNSLCEMIYPIASSILDYVRKEYPGSYLARLFQNREKIEQLIIGISDVTLALHDSN